MKARVVRTRNNLLALAAAVVLTALFTWGSTLIDLQVYRAGGHAWLNGLPLYGDGFPYLPSDTGLPFTYPPIAAVLFAPLALLPMTGAVMVLTLLTVLALAGTCVLVVRHLGRNWLLGLGFTLLCVLVEPVRSTLWLGQINVLLMVAVVADCLLPRTPWPRGLLIGLVAAIKLTPAAFGLYFVVARQWRPAGNVVLGFLGATALGFLLAPKDSLAYWFGVLAKTDRIGASWSRDNQSLRGLLARSGLPESTVVALWAVGVVVVVAVSWFVAARLRRRGEDLLALTVVAVAGLLASPVSWTTHWVWVVPALIGLVLARNRVWLAVVAVFFAEPHRLMSPHGHFLWWQHLVGNAYLIIAAALLVQLIGCTSREDVQLLGCAKREDVHHEQH
ncbi:alpha-1,2-mannosyltransferase [Allokutzneria albata]|uniref:Alpha-1,2-mannosyltransferase n=1 Tax=Allokutzneria albata TaxID=211114 RepID=A0A1H0D8G9_ALLAB|nr:alpha-1,2-mannosyltransferase [Allokutzneria albata]